MGFLEKAKGQFQKALTYFDQFLVLFPNAKEFSQILLAKSELYFDLNKLFEVQKYTDEFISLKPLEQQDSVREKLYKKYKLKNHVLIS